MRRKGLVALVVVGISFIGVSIALAALAGRSDGAKPVRYAEASLASGKATMREPEEILSEIIARYGGSAIVDASFGGPTPGWTGTDDPAEATQEGRWLYTTVEAPANDHRALRPIWEANLVAGALRDELHLAGIEGDLIASNTSVRLPTGETLDYVGGGMGNTEFGQSFSTPSDQAIEQGIREAAGGLNVRVNSVMVLHALQPAPAAVIVLRSDPQEFVREAGTIIPELFGGHAEYEGYYVEALDASGDPVIIQGTDFRTGVGQTWIRPDLDDRRKALSPKTG